MSLATIENTIFFIDKTDLIYSRGLGIFGEDCLPEVDVIGSY